MATKYESYITDDDGSGNIAAAYWDSQTFTPSVSHIITSVKLLIYRVGSPGTITVSIRATSSSVPTGADLCSGTTDGNTLTPVASGEWREITFTTGALLLAGIEYAICARATAGTPWTDYLDWRRDDSDPTYAGGQRATSDDSGVIWTAAPTVDFMFEEWGDPQGSGAGGSIFPGDDVARVSSIRHIYRPGLLRMQVGLGDLGFDIDVADATVRRELDTAFEPEYIGREKFVPPGPVPLVSPRIPGIEFEPEYIGRERARIEAEVEPLRERVKKIIPFGGPVPPVKPVEAPVPSTPSRIPGVKFAPAYIGRIAREKMIATIKRIIPFGGPGR